jgi:hypothetical protein
MNKSYMCFLRKISVLQVILKNAVSNHEFLYLSLHFFTFTSKNHSQQNIL